MQQIQGRFRLPGQRAYVLLAAIVLLGAGARFWNLNWDGGAYTLHPDEWALNEVVRRLGPDGHPHFFFYGTFPIYLYRVTAAMLGVLTGLDWLAPERLALVGRTYSALASTALLPLVFLVGRQLWGVGAGLVAAACTAGAALLIQAAHFGTVDTLVTLAGVTLLWAALGIAAGGGARLYAFAGVVLGLAVATKLTAGSFVLLPLLAHLLRRPPARGGWRCLALLAGVAAGTTLLAAPYYVLAWPEFWAAIVEQSDELSGGYRLSYTWQFIGATPYVFELSNLILWGLGLPLGLAALTGWGWVIADCGAQGAPRIADWLRTQHVTRNTQPVGSGQSFTFHVSRFARSSFLIPHSSFLLALWPTLYLLYIGTWEARFVRHMLPLAPFGCLFAAGGLMALAGALARRGAAGRLVGWVIGAGVVGGAAAWGLALLAIYAAPDTRRAASAWMHATLPPGTRLVVEDKNQLLPLPAPDAPLDRYQFSVLRVTDPDTPAKAAAFAATLAAGDVVVVPNRRWAGVLPRLPAFPLTGRYYRLLERGALGYTPLATFASPPRLGPWTWPDDGAEETFQVFDHPTVRLYRNTGRLPEADLLRRLQGEGEVKE